MNRGLFFTRIEKISILYFITIILCATFLVYVNTLGNGLFYDDEDFIYKNQYVQTFNIPKFFSENLIAGAGKVSNYYRPILAITFALEHTVGGNSGFLYHLDSMLLHGLASTILFLLIYKLFNSKLMALVTAVLFAIHPVQTEAVSYASGRGDPLSLFFMLLALYLSFSSSYKKKLISYVLTLLALLSKEITLITPFLILLAHSISLTDFHQKNLTKLFKISLPYFLICGIYFLLRLTVLNFQNTLNFYNTTNIYTQNIFIRLNTFFNLVPKYLSLLFYPNILYIERPSYVFTSITPSTVLVPLITIATFVLGVRYRKNFPIILFSLLWFYICFIPTSGIIPINGIFYEHFVYFPSIGFFLLASFLLTAILKKLPEGLAVLFCIIFGCYLALLSLRTIARNAEWHDPITFYSQTLTYTKSSRLLNNLAMAYAENAQYKESINIYNKAIKEGDYYPQTHYNLANSYLSIQDIPKAEKEYKDALKIDPSFYLSYIKLFEIYKTTNNKKGVEWVILQLEKLAKKNNSFTPLVTELKSQIN